MCVLHSTVLLFWNVERNYGPASTRDDKGECAVRVRVILASFVYVCVCVFRHALPIGRSLALIQSGGREKTKKATRISLGHSHDT